MEELVSSLTDIIVRRINDEKERLLKEAIHRKVGLTIDLELEVKKRFSRLRKEIYMTDKSEHYYWNDGSDSGLLIISFLPTGIFVDNTISNRNTITCGFRYL